MSRPFAPENLEEMERQLAIPEVIYLPKQVVKEAIAEIKNLRKYAAKLLTDETRVWECLECGFAFSSTVNDQQLVSDVDMLIQCAQCEKVSARPRAFILEDELNQKELRIDLLEDIIHQIDNWTKAYPLDIAPKPDLDADRKLLGEAEFSCLEADAMRHVIEGVKDIIKPAVEGKG